MGWPQARLGAALRPPMTRASIANIESGQQRVLLHTAVDVARALDIELHTLLGDGKSSLVAPDPEALVAELASKLEISRDRARSLVSQVARKNDDEKL